MTSQPTHSKFLSVSRFVETMDQLAKENKLPVKFDKDERILYCHIWFRGNECYEGKFDDIQITNPIYMRVSTTHRKDIFLKQAQIFKLFGVKPVLCIRQNMFRSVPRGHERKNMYLADIDFVEKESRDGYMYYPVEIYIEKSNNRIMTIENQFQSVPVADDNSDSSSDTV